MIHHLEINVSDLQRSSEFYSWFLGELVNIGKLSKVFF